MADDPPGDEQQSRNRSQPMLAQPVPDPTDKNKGICNGRNPGGSGLISATHCQRTLLAIGMSPSVRGSCFRTGAGSDGRATSGGMPEMDYLLAFAGLVDSVIDSHRCVQDRADIRSLSRDNPNVRKSAEKVHMVQKGIAEPRGSVSLVTRNIFEDFEKIVPRPWGYDYFEHRRASSPRTSSIGMPCPASSCAIPSAIAARV